MSGRGLMMLKRPQLRAYLISAQAPEVLEILADYGSAVASLNAYRVDPSKSHLAQEYATLCLELEEEIQKRLLEP